jgi:Resolvase, N terminal domain
MPQAKLSHKRCAIYTRKSSEEGLEQEFNSLEAQRDACEAYIRTGRIDIVVVSKVDRLTRSLADFARLVEIFDAQGVSFVSVTQQFTTTSSMGRLTLDVLLSFAQFEREVTGGAHPRQDRRLEDDIPYCGGQLKNLSFSRGIGMLRSMARRIDQVKADNSHGSLSPGKSPYTG